jgi:hypothetical protein
LLPSVSDSTCCCVSASALLQIEWHESLTSTVSCAYNNKSTICESFSPERNNFFTIFQATDRDVRWLSTVNGHIHLNVKQECFHNSSPEKLGGP